MLPRRRMGFKDRQHNQWRRWILNNQRFFVLFVICSFGIFYSLYTSKNSDSSRQNALHESSFIYRSSPRGEYLYHFPPSNDLRGIMFMAHGCSHSATDWFPKSPHCPQCLGLPEERALTEFVLKQKMIVISISSQDRQSKCWNLRGDIETVMSILSEFKKEHHIESLPLYAFGASSGGQFVGAMGTDSAFSTKLNLKGVIVQISAIGIDSKQLSQKLSVPVMYIPMARDQRLLEIVREQMSVLKKEDPNTISRVCEVKALPIDSMYFHQRIGGKVTKEISEKIYDGLNEKGHLDKDGFLMADPRRSSWRDIVKKSVDLGILSDGLKADSSPISEEMNVAFAMHELAAQCTEEMMGFIEAIEKS